jgi:hypothetical protein
MIATGLRVILMREKMLLDTLRLWHSPLYDAHSVTVAVEDAYRQAPGDKNLMECLAIL